MGLDVKQKLHEFNMQTPQGLIAFKVPHSQMKACSCGCHYFDKRYHVTWAKPANMLNAPIICLNVEVYVCSRCGEPVTIDNPVIG